MSESLKLCKRGEWKAVSGFYQYKKHGATYHSTRCKPCHCKRSTQWLKNNRDKVRSYYFKDLNKSREKARQTYHKHKDRYREKAAAASRRYHRLNRDVVLAKMREYGKRTRKQRNKQQNEHRRTNPDRCIANANRRRAIKLKAFVEDVRLSYLIERDGARCVYCGATDIKLTIDHVTPLSRGGKHHPANCVLACKSCNSAKGAKLPLIFLSERRA